jgi:transcriptional regulator with XRE-family HTH domain
MKLGRAIKLMRTAAGMKQKDVAAKIGVTSNYVSLVENGRREPSVSFLKQVAAILSVPVGLFFLWEEAESGPSKKGLDQVRGLLARLEAMYLFTNRRRRGRSAVQ